MKISSAACTFAAWAARQGAGKTILDIGAGSGVLSLMIAQQHPAASITAIEVEPEAAQEAANNFRQSPWVDQLSLICEDVVKWAFTQPAFSFDWIISNPPFFVNQIKNENEKRRFARHTDSLSPQSLAEVIAYLLSHSGTCHLLLPPDFSALFVSALEEKQIYPIACVSMWDTPQSPRAFGEIWVFQRQKNKTMNQSQLTLYYADRQFHENIKDLLASYYIVFS